MPGHADRILADGSIAEAVAAFLERVNPGAVLSVEDLSRPLGAGAPADLILYGDALARAADPVAAAASHVARLADEGSVLAVVPNAAGWRQLAAFLRGETVALGPSTTAVRGWLERAGLWAGEGFSVGDEEPEGRALLDALAPAHAVLGVDPAYARYKALSRATVIRAARPAPLRMMVHAVMLPPVAGCNDIRIELPHSFLARVPGFRIANGSELRPLADEGRLLIWQRPILRWDEVDRLKRALAMGFVLVTEFDDHPQRWPDIAANDHLSFTGVHAVQTSTAPLGALLAEHNPEVAVFPNTVPELLPPAPRDGRPPVLFFGALNRDKDWAPLMPALNAVLARHPEVRVDVIHDRGFFDALETEAKRFSPTCGYQDYRRAMAEADIALLPLRRTHFNAMKSDLKFVEAASLGLAVLASPTVYADSVVDGETGILFRSPDGFARGLTRLIEDEALRRRLGANARAAMARDRMMGPSIRQRAAWYRKLWTERARLTAALRERVPQLFAD